MKSIRFCCATSPSSDHNQVWAADTTYLPMRRGVLSLFAAIKWCSRRVLA